jgi:hypothetical protein
VFLARENIAHPALRIALLASSEETTGMTSNSTRSSQFHQLKAAIEIGGNPAVNVIKTVRQHSTLFLSPAIYLPGTTVFELLNYHE